jgi:hypothetical protein
MGADDVAIGRARDGSITGPRVFGSAAPQRIGKRVVDVPGSGCEVSRIWVERLGVFMARPGPSKDWSIERRRLPAA